MKSFTYVVKDELGIHARPAGMLVKEAGKFKCKLSIKKGDKEVDLKRLLNLMGLAVKNSDSVVITADGEDEADAIKTIEAFFKANL